MASSVTARVVEEAVGRSLEDLGASDLIARPQSPGGVRYPESRQQGGAQQRSGSPSSPGGAYALAAAGACELVIRGGCGPSPVASPNNMELGRAAFDTLVGWSAVIATGTGIAILALALWDRVRRPPSTWYAWVIQTARWSRRVREFPSPSGSPTEGGR